MRLAKLIQQLTEAQEMTPNGGDTQVLVLNFKTLEMHPINTGGISVHPTDKFVTIHITGEDGLPA